MCRALDTKKPAIPCPPEFPKVDLNNLESVVAQLEQEEVAFAESRGVSPRPFTDFIVSEKTIRIPWLFNDFNPNTKSDDELLLQISGFIYAIKRNISSKGLVEGSLEFNRALFGELISWINAPSGIGILPMQGANREMTIDEFFAQPRGKRTGDCSELSRLAYSIFRLAGLRPVFLYVTRNKIEPKVTEHMAIGVKLDPAHPDKLTTVDLSYNYISEEGHPEQSVMLLTSGLAVFGNNLATLIMEGAGTLRQTSAARVEELLLEAIKLDPNYPPAHYNYAKFLIEWRDDTGGACTQATIALKLRPTNALFHRLKLRACGPFSPDAGFPK